MDTATPENDYEKSIQANIKKHGWHLTSVASEESYNYSYTIGLVSTYGHPEVIVVGLPSDVSYSVVKDIVKRVEKGECYIANERDSELWYGEVSVFKEVSDEVARKHLLSAYWYYCHSKISVLQHVWPNQQGILPDSDEASPEFRRDQPILS